MSTKKAAAIGPILGGYDGVPEGAQTIEAADESQPSDASEAADVTDAADVSQDAASAEAAKADPILKE